MGKTRTRKVGYITVRKAHSVYLPLVVRRAEVVGIGHLERMEGMEGRDGMGMTSYNLALGGPEPGGEV